MLVEEQSKEKTNKMISLDPRLESFIGMFKTNLFLGFSWKSLTFVLLICQIALYLLMLIVEMIQNLELANILSQSQQSLFIFGEKYAYFIKYEKHIHRLILPLFLHSNFFQLTGNCLCQMYYFWKLEYLYGKKKFLQIYLLTGCLAIIISCLQSDTPGTCSQFPTLGIIGLSIGKALFQQKKAIILPIKYFTSQPNNSQQNLNSNVFQITNEEISIEEEPHCLYFDLIWFVFMAFMAFVDSNIDFVGQLDAFVLGLLLSPEFKLQEKNISLKIEKKQKFFEKCSTFILYYFAYCFLLITFFIFREPSIF